MERRIMSDVVRGQRFFVLKLDPREYEALVLLRDALGLCDFLFKGLDNFCRCERKRHDRACQQLYEKCLFFTLSAGLIDQTVVKDDMVGLNRLLLAFEA